MGDSSGRSRLRLAVTTRPGTLITEGRTYTSTRTDSPSAHDHVRMRGLLVSRRRDTQRVCAGLDTDDSKRPLFAGQDAKGRAGDQDRGLAHGKAVGCGEHRAFDRPASGLGPKVVCTPDEASRRDPQLQGPADHDEAGSRLRFAQPWPSAGESKSGSTR